MFLVIIQKGRVADVSSDQVPRTKQIQITDVQQAEEETYFVTQLKIERGRPLHTAKSVTHNLKWHQTSTARLQKSRACKTE